MCFENVFVNWFNSVECGDITWLSFCITRVPCGLVLRLRKSERRMDVIDVKFCRFKCCMSFCMK